jgi:GNAT superfamily N-acetyltransferase
MDVDEGLVRRLEATAATASLDLVEALRRLDPKSVAEGCRFSDGALIAMGPGRYVNRAIGVTLTELSSADVDAIEQFFIERGLTPMIELSSWAPNATLTRISGRGFDPRWFRSVFALALSPPIGEPEIGVRIERVDDDGLGSWLEIFNKGFEAEQGAALVANDEIGRAGFIVPDSHTFVAYLDGNAAGCGSVQVVDGVAWLGGAATVPAYRRRGVQAALVAHRLQLAADVGCELAAVTALSNGPSARNIVRLGFQHTHAQVVVERQSNLSGHLGV